MSVIDLALYAMIAAAVLGVVFLVTYGVVAIGLVFFKLGGARLPGRVRIRPEAVHLLKLFHIFCAASWLGSAVAMVVLSMVTARAVHRPCALDILALALKHVDQWVIIPMALSTVASGLLLAFFSGFGFRYPWVAAKAAGGFWALVVGWFFVTPMVRELASGILHRTLSLEDVARAGLFPASYYVIGSVQFSLLLAMLALSVFKPWRGGHLVDG